MKPVTVAFVLLCGLILPAAVPVLAAHSSPVFTPAAKRPSLAIDGTGLAGCPHTTNSCSTTLTTIHSNDIIIVYTFESLDLQPPQLILTPSAPSPEAQQRVHSSS